MEAMTKLGDFYIEVRCKTTGEWKRFSDPVPFEIELTKKTKKTATKKGFFGLEYRIDWHYDWPKIRENFYQGFKEVHQKLVAIARAFMETEKYGILYENIRISGDYWDPTYDGNGGNSFEIRGDYWRNGKWRDQF